MYTPIIQMVMCRQCPLVQKYPLCTACEKKASLDTAKARDWINYRKYWKMQTTILEKLYLKKGHRS